RRWRTSKYLSFIRPAWVAGSGGVGGRRGSLAGGWAAGGPPRRTTSPGGSRSGGGVPRGLGIGHPVALVGRRRGSPARGTSREIMGFFRELNKVEGITIILVTHDPEVARLADRAIVLVDGEVVVDTTDIALATEAIHKRAAMDEDA